MNLSYFANVGIVKTIMTGSYRQIKLGALYAIVGDSMSIQMKMRDEIVQNDVLRRTNNAVDADLVTHPDLERQRKQSHILGYTAELVILFQSTLSLDFGQTTLVLISLSILSPLN